MAKWRDGVSIEAQHDLDQLMDFAFGAVTDLLAEDTLDVDNQQAFSEPARIWV